jgi:hypothetical protein
MRLAIAVVRSYGTPSETQILEKKNEDGEMETRVPGGRPEKEDEGEKTLQHEKDFARSPNPVALVFPMATPAGWFQFQSRRSVTLRWRSDGRSGRYRPGSSVLCDSLVPLAFSDCYMTAM